MFGVMRQPLGSLPPQAQLEQQVYQAESESDAIGELQRLNRALLTSFLELLRATQTRPTLCCNDGELSCSARS
jgi:hypothetical protein